MTDRKIRWPAVGEAMTTRMSELVMSQADLTRASGLSGPVVRGLMKGAPTTGNPRRETKSAIAAALGWSADSIDRILSGDDPLVVKEPRTGLSRPSDVAPKEGFDTATELSKLSSSINQIINRLDEIPTRRQLGDILDELVAEVRGMGATVAQLHGVAPPDPEPPAPPTPARASRRAAP